MDNYKYGGSNSNPKSPNMSEYYNNQGGSSSRVQDLNQKYLTNLDTGNNSTKSLGGVTAVGTPRVNPTESDEEVNSLNSPYGVYNHEAHQQSLYNQPKFSMDEGEREENFSRPGSALTKRDSTTALNSTQNLSLMGQGTYDLGNVGNQHYNDYNQSNGNYSQYNKYHHQDDPYYDEEARHNTLTSENPYGEYTDRDVPGGGKSARQSMTGEHLNMPEKVKKKRKCCSCSCCTWPICLLITIIILAGLGVTGFFVFPRRPEFKIKEAIPITEPIISLDPPLIDMNFSMVIEINNDKNYVPYKFNRIDVSVFDRNVNNNESPIATGSKLDYTLVPKRIDSVDFPLNVNYKAPNQNDPVIQDFFSSCSPKVKKHTKLKLRVDVVLSISGIDWIYKPKFSEPIPDFNCPKLPNLPKLPKL